MLMVTLWRWDYKYFHHTLFSRLYSVKSVTLRRKKKIHVYVCMHVFTELCSQVLNNVIKSSKKNTLLKPADHWTVPRVTLLQKALWNETAT